MARPAQSMLFPQFLAIAERTVKENGHIKKIDSEAMATDAKKKNWNTSDRNNNISGGPFPCFRDQSCRRRVEISKGFNTISALLKFGDGIGAFAC